MAGLEIAVQHARAMQRVDAEVCCGVPSLVSLKNSVFLASNELLPAAVWCHRSITLTWLLYRRASKCG
jgi:hypothetical protein